MFSANSLLTFRDFSLCSVPSARLTELCPDCPTPTDMEDAEIKKTVSLSLEKFNNMSGLSNRFALLKINRAKAGVRLRRGQTSYVVMFKKLNNACMIQNVMGPFFLVYESCWETDIISLGEAKSIILLTPWIYVTNWFKFPLLNYPLITQSIKVSRIWLYTNSLSIPMTDRCFEQSSYCNAFACDLTNFFCYGCVCHQMAMSMYYNADYTIQETTCPRSSAASDDCPLMDCEFAVSHENIYFSTL